MNWLYKRLVLTVAIAGCAVLTKATPTLDSSETWTTGQNGWVVGNTPSASDPLFTVTHDAINGRLVLTVPPNDGFPGIGRAVTDGSGNTVNFLGDYTTLPGGTVLTFQFLTFGDTPTDLGFYFQSNGRTYTYDLILNEGAPVLSGSRGYIVPILSYAGWDLYGGGGSEAQYLSDLATVSAIGITLQGSSPISTETYGLDNLGFAVPEPESVCMILAVALSMMIMFRSRLNGMVSFAKARIQRA